MEDADPKTNKVPDEETTSSHGPHAPRRDKTPERNYPDFERKDAAVNRTDPAAPKGPVNIGVKKDGADAKPAGATDHPATGAQGSSSMPEE